MSNKIRRQRHRETKSIAKGATVGGIAWMLLVLTGWYFWGPADAMLFLFGTKSIATSEQATKTKLIPPNLDPYEAFTDVEPWDRRQVGTKKMLLSGNHEWRFPLFEYRWTFMTQSKDEITIWGDRAKTESVANVTYLSWEPSIHRFQNAKFYWCASLELAFVAFLCCSGWVPAITTAWDLKRRLNLLRVRNSLAKAERSSKMHQ